MIKEDLGLDLCNANEDLRVFFHIISLKVNDVSTSLPSSFPNPTDSYKQITRLLPPSLFSSSSLLVLLHEKNEGKGYSSAFFSEEVFTSTSILQPPREGSKRKAETLQLTASFIGTDIWETKRQMSEDKRAIPRVGMPFLNI